MEKRFDNMMLDDSDINDSTSDMTPVSDQQTETSCQIDGRCLRQTAQRTRHVEKHKVKRSRASQKRKPKLGRKSKSAGVKAWESRSDGVHGIWTGEGRIVSGKLLPAPEEEFLADMLSENPRFQSNSQRKPAEHWEITAAALPEYRGPWQPASTTSSPTEFEFNV